MNVEQTHRGSSLSAQICPFFLIPTGHFAFIHVCSTSGEHKQQNLNTILNRLAVNLLNVKPVLLLD